MEAMSMTPPIRTSSAAAWPISPMDNSHATQLAKYWLDNIQRLIADSLTAVPVVHPDRHANWDIPPMGYHQTWLWDAPQRRFLVIIHDNRELQRPDQKGFFIATMPEGAPYFEDLRQVPYHGPRQRLPEEMYQAMKSAFIWNYPHPDEFGQDAQGNSVPPTWAIRPSTLNQYPRTRHLDRAPFTTARG